MEDYAEKPLEIVEGQARIEVQERLTNYHRYRVFVESPARLVENTLYFPGWEVLANGLPQPVEFQDPNHRGLMTFRLEPGDNLVEVKFGETKLRKFANSLSAASLLFLGMLLFGDKITTGKKKMRPKHL